MFISYLFTLGWKDLFRYKGRLSQRDYVLGSLCVGLAWMVIFFGCGVAAMRMSGPPWIFLLILFDALWIVAVTISMTARRLHDIGLSGWVQLVELAPMGQFLLFILFFIPGEKEENSYGRAESVGRGLNYTDGICGLLFLCVMGIFLNELATSAPFFKDASHSAAVPKKNSVVASGSNPVRPGVFAQQEADPTREQKCIEAFWRSYSETNFSVAATVINRCPTVSWNHMNKEMTSALRRMLIFSVAAQDVSVLESVLAAGVNPNFKVKLGEDTVSLLHIALLKEDTRLTELLLRYQADPNVRDNMGSSPLVILLYGSSKGEVQKMRLMLDAGASVNLKNNRGFSTADLAPYSPSPEIRKMVEEASRQK